MVRLSVSVCVFVMTTSLGRHQVVGRKCQGRLHFIISRFITGGEREGGRGGIRDRW